MCPYTGSEEVALYLLGRIILLASVAAVILPADHPPYRILRGEVVDWEVTEEGGEFTWRAADLRRRKCAVNSSTFYMTGDKRVAADRIQRGATIEFIASGDPASEGECLALTIYLRLPPLRRSPASEYTAARRPPVLLDNLWPRGNLTFAGVVERIDARELRLRTRKGEEHVLVLRDDTSYRKQGRRSSPSELTEQTQVYVRAGRNLFGEVEAYHIIWGEILSIRDNTQR